MADPARRKDQWDKADILLKPMGGLLTAVAVAVVGTLGTAVLEERQHQEADQRLYTQLITSRETADSGLRQEMLKISMQRFLSGNPLDTTLEQRVLALELLAYNFHDTLDLGPLFKHVRYQVDLLGLGLGRPARDTGDWPPERLLKRLERVAGDVNRKQIAALRDVGHVFEAPVDLAALVEDVAVIVERDASLGVGQPFRNFSLQGWGVDPSAREVEVMLAISIYVDAEGNPVLKTPGQTRPRGVLRLEHITPIFKVGFFDFPMIDNTSLTGGDRVAVVLKRFTDADAELSLAYFPASRASLKEKRYYDEVLEELREIRVSEGDQT